ncbi:MAG TPA: hypothetical protein VME20_09120 [Acidimicrobiales bacterium]|nr:hypothetical protein [Acidimicrobiales bacterium]
MADSPGSLAGTHRYLDVNRSVRPVRAAVLLPPIATGTPKLSALSKV